MMEKFSEWQSSTIPTERKQSNESTWDYLINLDGQTRNRFFLGGVLSVLLSPIWVPPLLIWGAWLCFIDRF